MKTFSAIVGLVFLVSTPVFAVAPTAVPLYEIEVLVFEQRHPDLEGNELWAGQPAEAPALLSEAVSAPAAVPGGGETTLARAAVALQKDGRYRVLAHARWQQPAEARSAVTPVRIAGMDPSLDGALRFYMSRFLHVELAFVLREQVSGGFFSGAPREQVYLINEQRRIRTKEVNYFDHPKFGVLVRVAQVGRE